MKRNLLNLAIFFAINVTLALSSVAIAAEIATQDSYAPQYKGKGRK